MSAVNPYESPKSNTSIPSSSDTYQPKLLSVSGRIGRLRYLAYGTLLTVVTLLIIGIAVSLMPSLSSGLLANSIDTGAVVLLIALYLPLIIFSIILMKRRLNDLDRSGWWQLLVYLPIIGLILAIYILFWPGTDGSNSYGPKPVKNSTAIIIGGLLLPILIALGGILAAISIPAYQDYVARTQ